MVINKLFRALRNRYKCFPDDYMVIDLETTGLDPHADLIGQIGHCVVVDRKPVNTVGIVLNWAAHPGVDHAWLQRRLEETKYHVENKDGNPTGRRYCLSMQRMLQEGADPIPILAFYLDWLKEIRQQGKFIIAHNGYNFDCRWLEVAFKRFLGATWRFGDNEVFDTGMAEKASQANIMPWQEESLRAFSERVGDQRLKGVRWALDHHCAPKYGLAKKYNIDIAKAHEAGHDCLMAHYLFEEFRNLAGEENKHAASQPAQGSGSNGGVGGPSGGAFAPDPGA